MTQRREAPEPWATAMRDRGFAHRGVPSMTRLAEKSGLGVQTVVNLIFGHTGSTVETVTAVATALRDDRVYEWAGMRQTEREPWVPPAEAHLLSKNERSALDALIRAVAERASENRDHTAPMTVTGEPNAAGGVSGRVHLKEARKRRTVGEQT